MSGTMKTVVGLVGIAIALIIFPIVLDGAGIILGNANLSNYTGLESVVKIAPLIIFVGILFGSGWSIWSGTGMSGRIRRRKTRQPVKPPRY